MWTGLSLLRNGPVPTSCERYNEPSSFVKVAEFIEQLNDCQLLKQVSAQWS